MSSFRNPLFKHCAKNFSASIEKILPGHSALLTKHNAVIAGGSVLAAIVPSLEFDDYDIWVPFECKEAFLEDFAKLGVVKNNHDYELSYIESRYVFVVESGEKFDILVCTKDRAVFDQIMNFDLDICKCLYDGKNILSLLGNLEDKIIELSQYYIFSLWAHVNGNSTFLLDEFPKLPERLIKYVSRGFRLKINGSFAEGEKLIEALKNRKRLIILKPRLPKELLGGDAMPCRDLYN